MEGNKISNTIHQFHLVRAIACIGVVATHARFVLWSGGREYMQQHPEAQWSWWEYPVFFVDMVTSLGPPRVFFFFILSGFFLQYSSRKGLAVVPFLRSRLLRLYPAYVVAVVATLAAFVVTVRYINPALAYADSREFNRMLHAAASDLSWASFGHTLLFLKSKAPFAATMHLWSMLHEAVFCLVFPLYYHLSIRKRVVLTGLVFGLGWATGEIVIQAQLFFLLGMLFCDFFSSKQRLPLHLANWAYYLVLGVLYLASYGMQKLGYVWYACVPMVLFALLVFDFVLNRNIRVPSWCVSISKASYAIYLNHVWVLLLYYGILSRLTGTITFHSRWPYYSGIGVAILVSWPMYRLVDAQISAYLSRRKKQQAPPAQLIPPLSLPLPLHIELQAMRPCRTILVGPNILSHSPSLRATGYTYMTGGFAEQRRRQPSASAG